MSRLYLVIWIICGYMGYMLFYGLCRLFVVIIHNLIHIYICMFLVCFIHNHFSNILPYYLYIMVAVFQDHIRMIKNSKANNIYIMEMPILGLMIPKKNAAVCNGITIVLYEMEGCNMAPKFKGFLPRFPRWAVYEMMLVFPFHTGNGFFHSIQVQSRGIYSTCSKRSTANNSSIYVS